MRRAREWFHAHKVSLERPDLKLPPGVTKGRQRPQAVQRAGMGGRRSGRHRAGGPAPHELDTPEGLCSALGTLNPVLSGKNANRQFAWDWETERMSALLSAHAASTRKQYTSGWKYWLLFCRVRPRESPFLTREGGMLETRGEENVLLDFALWQYRIGKGESSIHIGNKGRATEPPEIHRF